MPQKTNMLSRIIKKIELGFKAALRFPFFLFLKKGRKPKLPLDLYKIKSILILRPDKLGDMIVTVPVIHELKSRFTHLKIEIVASPRNKMIIENDPLVDKVHLYLKNILKDWPMMRQLKKKSFDLIYDPICKDSITGLLLTKLIKNRSITVASRKENLRKYYDYCLPYLPDGDDHNIDNSLVLFDLFDIKKDDINPFHSVHIPQEAKTKAEQFWQNKKSDTKKYIGLNISAGSESRTLQKEKNIILLDSLSGNYPELEFVLFCVMPERQKALDIIDASSAKINIIPENSSFLEAVAIMSKLDMLISPDTSMIHIARLMEIPVVGIYSNHARNLNSWRPYRQKNGTIVSKSLTDIHDINPEQIVEQFNLLYNEISKTGS